MEYQIVSLIDICQFNLTHLNLTGQQLHVHVKLLSDDYGKLLVLFPDIVCCTLNQSGECTVSGNINTLPKKVKQGGGGYVNVKPKINISKFQFDQEFEGPLPWPPTMFPFIPLVAP